ncbi:AEC family transporter [Luteococcus peritonei]|uniref:AEC family transporter n=1 Tax=Luteococcus peritonei TaxID=88874 RepID=A0ABW4RU91_9ACTN
MLSVLSGFVAIWFVVGVGWLLAHRKVLDSSSQLMLSKVSFFAGNPALMVTMMSTADLKRIFAENLVVTVLATLATGLLYLLASVTVLREADGSRIGMGHRIIGTFCSCYVNAGNMGLPIAAYVLHDVTWIAPLLLVQVGVLQPLGLAFLDIEVARGAGGTTTWLQNLLMPLRNPMTLGTLAGLGINLAGWSIPTVLLQPLTMLGNLAVPTMLLAFGVSLRLGALPGKGPQLPETVLASTLKLVVQPLLALGLARLFGLDATTTLAVMVLAGLPTAQNIFSHAVRYQQSVALARDVVFITSIASIGTIMTMAVLIG